MRIRGQRPPGMYSSCTSNTTGVLAGTEGLETAAEHTQRQTNLSVSRELEQTQQVTDM
jgi:hypothetical protein